MAAAPCKKEIRRLSKRAVSKMTGENGFSPQWKMRLLNLHCFSRPQWKNRLLGSPPGGLLNRDYRSTLTPLSRKAYPKNPNDPPSAHPKGLQAKVSSARVGRPERWRRTNKHTREKTLYSGTPPLKPESHSVVSGGGGFCGVGRKTRTGCT